MSAFSDWLLDPSGLTPHGFCLLWQPWLIWTYATADILIGISYLTIPIALGIVARKRRDLVFRPLFFLFAAFILLCGISHLLCVLTLWVPAYELEAAVKAGTAIVSIVTAIALWRLLPGALKLPSHQQMRAKEQALQDNDALHQANFELAPMALYATDTSGRITAVSDRWIELLGYPRNEVIGRPFWEILDASSAESCFAWWTELQATGDPLRDVERRYIRRDRRLLDTLTSVTFQQTTGTPNRIAVFAIVDVTGHKEAEAALEATQGRLRQAQKMEAIGQLTGGIAHDFNNVLQVMMGNVDLIQGRMSDDLPDIARLANGALEAGKRAAGLTGQLLTFAGRQKLNYQILNPVDVVEDMLPLLARALGDRITLQMTLGEKVGFLRADRNLLESALLNLVINARDAIADQAGAVTVSLGAERITSLDGEWPPTGHYVRIAVADDGPGMTEEVCRRAFEPFFTTKGENGSGLGLAQIHGFVHQSGGTTMIQTSLGQGTEVSILLPRCDAAAATAKPDLASPANDQTPVGSGEIVLLVEDDAAVRQSMAYTLRTLGYEPVEAESGDAGLLLLLSRPSICAVLTDISMPGNIDGLDLAELAAEQRPEVPVVLITGHPDPGRQRQLPPKASVVHKPSSRDRIGRVLARVIGGSDDPGMAEPADQYWPPSGAATANLGLHSPEPTPSERFVPAAAAFAGEGTVFVLPAEGRNGSDYRYGRIEKALQKSEERFRLVVEAAPSAMVMVRATGQIEMVNAQAERVFGYGRKDLLGQSIEILVPERFRGHHSALRRGFFNAPELRPMGAGRELFGVRKDGIEFPIEIGLNPIETEDGAMVLSSIVDISERAEAARALARSEAEFRASFEGAAVGKVLADPVSRRILRANRAFGRMLGCEPDELVGRSTPDFIWLEDQAVDAADYARLLSGEEDTHVSEMRYVHRDGSPFWVRVSATLARPAGSSDKTIAVAAIEDIDTRYKAEAALRVTARELERVLEERTNALTQRDLLLREVYHRVKNNLQIVDSLIMMQARKIDDPQARQALSSLRDRVFALGLVHQQLMGSADLKTFDVVPFLDELSKNILEGVGMSGVSLTVDACTLDVGLDFAVPLGLLVTELVTNSLKHAFPDGTGNISVVLQNESDRTLVLIVSDDGPGPYRSDTPDQGKAGIGTRIIESLVAQLEGTIVVKNEGGTTTEIRIAAPVLS